MLIIDTSRKATIDLKKNNYLVRGSKPRTWTTVFECDEYQGKKNCQATTGVHVCFQKCSAGSIKRISILHFLYKRSPKYYHPKGKAPKTKTLKKVYVTGESIKSFVLFPQTDKF